ncbi:HmuY family protein [Aquimarina celericrescens]|uniref:HmuY family protein n=1 Tax=Aquimarina celericrescens TaxID=1964542 RepID=A0ABW5B0S9_9FLAO|nr:HmuY family protein [Aquimarina celericrescens]
MKTFKPIILLLIMLFATACSSDDDSATVTDPVVSQRFSNLHAPQTGGQGQPVGGTFTKFDFSTGQITTSETEWDIAFRGTTIAINGGSVTGTKDEPLRNGNVAALLMTDTFNDVKEVPETSEFLQDSDGAFAIPTGSGNGWYNYNFQTNIVSPIAGKILVFRTRNNRYAKLEILSYYKDAPTSPDPTLNEGRYYTFNYVYNPNEGDKNLEL